MFLFACMFYPNSFNIMRQYLALSIAINSYTFYKNDHILKALIIILISSFFHSTSLLLMIPLILFKIKHWKLIRNSILVFSILLFMFSDSIIPNILNLLEKSYYISRYDVSQIFRLTTFLTMLFSLFFWYILHHKKSFLFNDYINHFTCIVYCNFAFGLLYLKYEYFSRLIELYNIFLLISMPFGIYIMKSYYRPLLKIAAYIIPIFIMINSVFNSGSGVENYRMFFMIM